MERAEVAAEVLGPPVLVLVLSWAARMSHLLEFTGGTSGSVQAVASILALTGILHGLGALVRLTAAGIDGDLSPWAAGSLLITVIKFISAAGG